MNRLKQKKAADAAAGADPARFEKLHARALEVATLVGSVLPSTFELVERIRDMVACADPWNAMDQRRSLTSTAARLAAANQALLGLLGEADLALADSDDLAAGLADRGILLPRNRRGRRR